MELDNLIKEYQYLKNIESKYQDAINSITIQAEYDYTTWTEGKYNTSIARRLTHTQYDGTINIEKLLKALNIADNISPKNMSWDIFPPCYKSDDWIDANKKLPSNIIETDKSREYLVCVQGSENIHVATFNGEKFVPSARSKDVEFIDKIVYWQYMPKLPMKKL